MEKPDTFSDIVTTSKFITKMIHDRDYKYYPLPFLIVSHFENPIVYVVDAAGVIWFFLNVS